MYQRGCRPGPTSHVRRPFPARASRAPRTVPVAASCLHAGNHVRRPGSTGSGRTPRRLWRSRTLGESGCFTAPRIEKCPHVKFRLRRSVGRLAPDRARVPRETSSAETSGAGATLDMRGARLDVVAAPGECADRTRRKARPIGAGLAGTDPVVTGRQGQPFAERDCAPVCMPQAEVRMHQRPDGRGMHGTRSLRPSDERQPGRAAERKVGRAVEPTGQTRDHAAAPPVEGVRQAVVRFVRSRKDGPHSGTRIADENERRGGCAVRKRRDRVVRRNVERAAAREPFGFDGGHDEVEESRG